MTSPVRNTTVRNATHSEMRFEQTTRAMTGGITLTTTSPTMQFLDPDGSARTIVLPAEADSNGLFFIHANQANAAEDLTYNDDGGTTIGVVGQDEVGIFFCNGIVWKAMITGIGAANAASDVTLLDAGGFTSQVEVEAALQELYQHLLSTQSMIYLPLMNWLNEGAGTLVTVVIFAAGNFTLPGFTNISNEGLGIRWNNHANPDPIITQFEKPTDMDTLKNAIVHVLAIRSATDSSDLVTFTITAFDNIVGAVAGADADFGGTTGAMSDDVNVQEVSLTLAAANLSSTQGAITISVQPTDGLLDTIDVTILGIWIEYSKLVLTS